MGLLGKVPKTFEIDDWSMMEGKKGCGLALQDGLITRANLIVSIT